MWPTPTAPNKMKTFSLTHMAAPNCCDPVEFQAEWCCPHLRPRPIVPVIQPKTQFVTSSLAPPGKQETHATPNACADLGPRNPSFFCSFQYKEVEYFFGPHSTFVHPGGCINTSLERNGAELGVIKVFQNWLWIKLHQQQVHGLHGVLSKNASLPVATPKLLGLSF